MGYCEGHGDVPHKLWIYVLDLFRSQTLTFNKMRVIALISALLGIASARIVGVAAPTELAPGADLEVTLITENYIQSVLDVSAAVGLSPVVFPDTLGVYVGSFYLGPGKIHKDHAVEAEHRLTTTQSNQTS